MQKMVANTTIGLLLLLTGCSISVDNTVLDFGSTDTTKTFIITVKGSLKWSIECSESWVTVASDSGQGPGQYVIDVVVDRTALDPGDYEAALKITTWPTTSAPTITVEMTVEEVTITTTSTTVTTCSVSWENDVQITSTGDESIYPTLGSGGGILHLAWVDLRDGNENREIYYNRSIDSGTTWQVSDTRLSNDPAYSIKACFAVNENAVHLFWRDDRHENFEEYLIQSKDGGLSWGPETRLTNASGLSGCPFPTVYGDTLNLFWRDDRPGVFKIYQKRSVDAGTTWGEDILLTPYGEKAEFPFPAINGNDLHLVWRDNRDGNAEIYYKHSSDGGVSWGEDRRLTNDEAESEHPKIAVRGENIHVVWRDDRDGNHEIYYKNSEDGGQTWSEDTRLTDNSGKSLWPVLAVSDNLLHILWCDDSDGSQALYYAFSSDEGNTWSEETRLSDCYPPNDLLAAIPMLVTDTYIHLVFNDERTGENEIYYKRGTISCP